MVGVSYNTIGNWAKKGLLHPAKEMRTLTNGTVREVTVFALNEVMKIARRRDPDDPGEVAARAFELFAEGRPLRDVVIQLRQAPEKVEALHEQWMSCGGAELVINAVAQRELERLLGPFEGVADLVQRVAELASRAVIAGISQDQTAPR